MTVHIEWGNPETDWDLYIVNAAGEVVTAVGVVRRHRPRTPCSSTRRRATTSAHVVNYDQVDGAAVRRLDQRPR